MSCDGVFLSVVKDNEDRRKETQGKGDKLSLMTLHQTNTKSIFGDYLSTPSVGDPFYLPVWEREVERPSVLNPLGRPGLVCMYGS